MSKFIRSFIALYPDPVAREHMAAFVACMRARDRSCRWEQPEKVHITLKFLGDVLPATLEEVASDLRKEVPAEGEIAAEINRTGAFPNMKRPRIVWLGFNDTVPRVLSLQRLTEEVCARHGLQREEKEFTPHFTVGRLRRGASAERLENELAACSFQPATVHFSDVRIMESTLTPQGAIHRERARIALVPGD
ncbi:MAG: RNA 2',3'-cyclic phosphodiesterase [Bacteroidota bacterium]|nr:RNA 2',3'-cyclic phosphodiesterase [Bacteroidota bacterium]